MEEDSGSEDLLSFDIDSKGCLRKKGRIYVPNVWDLRKEVLDDCHCSRYMVHPGGSKMYMDMKRMYFWEGMKRDIGDNAGNCFTCQLVKAEHQKPSGLHQPFEIPQW